MSEQIFASLNNEHRLRALDFRIPHVGAWQADVVTDDAIDPALLTDGITVTIGDLSARGTIIRAEPWQGTTRARIVAGGGGWQRYTKARYYSTGVGSRGVRRSTVLADIASEVNETIATGLDDVQLSPWFCRPAGPASWVWQYLGLSWRVLDNGSTTFAPYEAGPVGATFVPMAYDAHKGVVTIATEAVEQWRPRKTFSAPQLPRTFTVDSVIHRMTAGTLRTELWVR